MKMISGIGFTLGTILITFGGFQNLPLWLCILTVVPLLIGLLFVFFGITGLPGTWAQLLREEILVVESGQPLQMLLVNAVRLFELLVVPIPRLIFPETSRKLSNCLPKPLRVLGIEESSVIEPSAQQQQNIRAGCSGEAWIFVNGIMTTKGMAQSNSESVFRLFGRPVTVIYNPTDSMFVDLIECWLGKLRSNFKSGPRKLGVDTVRKALLDDSKQKVVLLCHSQGTIIASNVLADLNAEATKDAKLAGAMNKLEVFAFATCAHRLLIGKASHVESICNEWDAVAMVGVLCPTNVKDACGREIAIEGDIVKESGKYGYMFIVHYLNGLAAGQYKGSRLHTYMK